jgi:hypothetical protein|tara:strand:+ start:466 stop:678 length:213 start_codon:yes stop_codon:yes gene_type:complete
MKEKGKMKISKRMMDSLIRDAEEHMVGLFATGEILRLLEEDRELLAASVPSILMDREYFRNEFDMIIGEA